MSIKDWPEQERPREKLLTRGVQALSDAELLAVFLRTGVAGKTALDIARELLTQFGGLRGLLNASRADFKKGLGLGDAKYAILQASLEMSRRHLAERLYKEGPLDSPQTAQDFLRAQLRDRQREVFSCVYLDSKHQVIGYEELFEGTISGATVHSREVVKHALGFNAAALIIAHNHPSGIAEPSSADEALTKKLKQALALVDIRLLDHLIIGDGECVSLSERGVL